MKRVVIWGVLGALILGFASAVPASAAAAETPKFGIVDMTRVAAEYRQMQDLNQQFQDFQQKQEQQLQQKHATRLLTDAERQEYSELTTTGAPTDANKKRLQELSGKREQRMNELREKAGRTTEEEAEFKQWSGLYDQRMTELAGLQADLQSSREAEYERLTKIVADSVSNAVKSVAEEQKLALVVKKDAVLYGGTDVTDAVLSKLNGPATAPKPAS